MASNELFAIPKFIIGRFQWVNAYIWDELFPEERIVALTKNLSTKKERNARIKELKSIAQEASIAYFIYDVRRFFNAGSAAAKNAVDIFKELDVDGFLIGSTLFKGRNENVMLGEQLSERLLEFISDPNLKSILQNTSEASRVIDYYKIVVTDRYGR